MPRIRARSGNRCECTGQCGRIHNRRQELVEGEPAPRCGHRHREVGFYDAGEWRQYRPMFDRAHKEVTIILTVMHLNHQPEDCSDANLLHACQGCHNRYDMPKRAADRKGPAPRRTRQRRSIQM